MKKLVWGICIVVGIVYLVYRVWYCLFGISIGYLVWFCWYELFGMVRLALDDWNGVCSMGC